MKKTKFLCLLLAMIAAFQLISLPVSATQVIDTTEADEDPPIESFDGTDASITKGCRTIEAQVPLYGSGKMLKTCESALLFEVNSGTMMYAYNPDKKLDPSSFVKLMTALIAVEEGDLLELVDVTQGALDAVAAGAVVVDLVPGERISLLELVYCLLTGSGNDAAAVIAEHIGGSQEAFVSKMNRRAKDLGMVNTVYVNAHGAPTESQVTTARDTAKLMLEAFTHPFLVEVIGTVQHTVDATNMSEKRTVRSTNFLQSKITTEAFYDERVIGGRTGTTKEGRYSLVNMAKSGNYQYLTVVMSAEVKMHENNWTILYHGSFQETTELLSLGFRNQSYSQILNDGQVLDQFPVENGANHVAGGVQETVYSILPSSVGPDDLVYRTQSLTRELKAPIQAGDKLSVIQVWYGNVCVAQSDLYAFNNVDRVASTGGSDPIFGFDAGALSTAMMVLGIIFTTILVLGGGLFLVRSVRGAMTTSKKRQRRENRRRSR